MTLNIKSKQIVDYENKIILKWSDGSVCIVEKKYIKVFFAIKANTNIYHLCVGLCVIICSLCKLEAVFKNQKVCILSSPGIKKEKSIYFTEKGEFVIW